MLQEKVLEKFFARNYMKERNAECVSEILKSTPSESSIARLKNRISNVLLDRSIVLFNSLRSERGDVPGWVLVVLMTTGLVTGIWTLAAPRIDSILRNSLDSMNGIR